MSSLAEIEAAAASLPDDEQRSLLEWLSEKVRAAAPTSSYGHSILDIAPVSLGGIIRLPGDDDDILGEMLEDRT